MSMSSRLFVRNLQSDVSLDDLIIYFQSSRSGGGDVQVDKCEMNGDFAVVVFEQEEDLKNVLQRDHEIKGCKIEISNRPFKELSKKRSKKPSLSSKPTVDQNKAYLGESRSVIVSCINPDTTSETLSLFFENNRRTGGGDIEKLTRVGPELAHVTFVKAEVAAEVLKREKLELEGYVLQLKEKPPKLYLPFDKKKLYVENIDPKTTEDSLSNYMELRAKVEVRDLQWGVNHNALVTFDEELDLDKVLREKKKPLEGAQLKISHPPVCNTLLITGLTHNTTKQAIEMYFESEKNGGGKIYGEVIHQKERGEAIVSFCDPDVVKSLSCKDHNLNGAVLNVHEHYHFMNEIKELRGKKITLDKFVIFHINQKCRGEFCHYFGAEMLKKVNENPESLMLPGKVADDMMSYFDQFVHLVIPFSQKLLETSSENLYKLCSLPQKQDEITALVDKTMLRVVANKEKREHARQMFQNAISKMEKRFHAGATKLTISGNKLKLFQLHGIDQVIKNECQVDVNVVPMKNTITIKGGESQTQQAKSKILGLSSQVTEDVVEIKEGRKRFLESGNLCAMNYRMRDAKLKGIILLSEELKKCQIRVLVFNSTSLKDINAFLNENLFERQLCVHGESSGLLQSSLWQDFKRKAIGSNTAFLHFIENGYNKVFLVGEKKKVQESYLACQDFLMKNTIMSKNIPVSEGLSRFLKVYSDKEIQNIMQEFPNATGKIEINDKTLDISGTRCVLDKATKTIESILSKVSSDKIQLLRPRVQEYFNAQEGGGLLTKMERQYNCVIHISEDDDNASNDSSNESRASSSKGKSKFLGHYETQEKISLRLFQGDITKHGCEVIVNAANKDLKLIGGVAKCILKAGGKEIQDECDAYVRATGQLSDGECYVGRAGNLHQCKRIIHAVAPRWDKSSQNKKLRKKVRETLHVTFMKAFDLAKEYRTVAIPALGSGIFGIPKDVCADVMIQAAEEFSKSAHHDCKLKEIHFVNNDTESCKALQITLDAKFGKSLTTTPVSRVGCSPKEKNVAQDHLEIEKVQQQRPESIVADDVHHKVKSADHILTKGSMKISVVIGDLSKYQADVLVNTTSESLQLNANPCSQSLSSAAGPELQKSCNKYGSLKLNDMAITQGGNLHCDNVYHVVCVKWNDGEGEKVLRSIIKKCLSTCHSTGKLSIAFPAIGTGILGFPPDATAKIFFEETKSFERKVSTCNIKEVVFVIFHKDLKTIEAFQNELKQQEEWNESSESEVGEASGFQQRSSKNFNSSEDDKSNVGCIEVCDNKKVEIVKGDITKETTDVIAFVTNPRLKMDAGVGKTLSKAGGKDIQLACEQKVKSGPISTSTTILTTSGQLNVKFVAHMVVSNTPSLNEIGDCLNNCLALITKKKLESISFPAVGTGSLKCDAEEAALTILNTIVRFLQSSPGLPNKVRIVIREDKLVKVFQEAVKNIKLDDDDESDGFVIVRKKPSSKFRKFESSTSRLDGKFESPHISKTMFLFIYAQDMSSLMSVKGSISKAIKSLRQ
ncbi:protein mono-ADP-ribosyltransferase PARP14-like isoform X2 [Xenia sp. Carnegie-2017]|uniref:protein mono-ADP-ribosyltransferase PARP14-like isoform X2 n=1 Tax=Xenia sp. Carnegie-2017 TaxID=2897299 RepID=UPI001F04DB82|nr:protein mono-ADP-ribosyltransferase PARP14-like isoform X2 [Xenia sp. Carnegie-2017]